MNLAPELRPSGPGPYLVAAQRDAVTGQLTPANTLRFLALLGLVLVGLLVPRGHDTFLILTGLSISALDNGRWLATRNIVLAYHFALLGIGPYLFRLANPLAVQRLGVGMLLAFTGGIVVRHLYSGRRAPAAARAPVRPQPDPEAARRYQKYATGLLKLALLIQVALLLMDVSQYGPRGYLQGLSLSSKISSYAHGGLDSTQIVKNVAGIMILSCVAAYVALSEPNRAYHWRLLVLILIVFPILRLDRSGLIPNSLVLVFLAGCARMPGTRRTVRYGFLVAATLSMILLVAVSVGVLRASNLPTGQNSGSVGSSNSVLDSEISPVQVVSDSLQPGAPRFHGQSLYSALVWRYVPRQLYPNKPANTISRYMEIKDPVSFAAGYSLAPTAVGVIIYNYGVTAAYVIALVVGFGLRRTGWPTRSIGYKCLGLFCLYTLLRDDPSNSLAYAGASLVVYRLIIAFSRFGRRGKVTA